MGKFFSKLDDFARKSVDVATGGSDPLGKKLGINSNQMVDKLNLTSREYGQFAMFKNGGLVRKANIVKLKKAKKTR